MVHAFVLSGDSPLVIPVRHPTMVGGRGRLALRNGLHVAFRGSCPRGTSVPPTSLADLGRRPSPRLLSGPHPTGARHGAGASGPPGPPGCAGAGIGGRPR